MSKAEAIVVSEPKQKVVPTFNEKEVIGIVNGGIQTGQVAIPAGGMKLYQHNVTIDNTNNIFIISASAEPINATESLYGGWYAKHPYNKVINIQSITRDMMQNDTWLFLGAGASSSLLRINFINFETGAISQNAISSTTVLTDTVTEL